MEDSQLSFEALARETMELSRDFKNQEFSFEDDFSFHSEEPVETPSGFGLLYRLEKGISTFCVRGFPSADLQEDFEGLKEGDREIIEALKITESENMDEVRFFPTESKELAETICDELVNRRFPIEEDILCNLSDPGFSWWMDEGDDHFQVFFKSHGIHRADDYIRLGPLGDSTIASNRILKAENIFRGAFPVGEFVSTDKGFAISTTDPKNPNFLMLKNFFLTGENSTTEETYPSTIDGKTLYFYFKEVSVLREFWLRLEKDMTE